MSTLILALTLVVLSVASFFLGVAIMASGLSQKVREIEGKYHHHGKRWEEFINWLEK